MRKRFQHGRVVKSRGYWIGKWIEDGHDRSKVLGKLSKMTKSKAQEDLAKIVRPVNERAADAVSPMVTMKCFVEDTYFPLFRRKWKRSTAMTTEDRIRHHIVDSFGQRELRSLKRKDLQALLESKAHLSFSTVDHLRWDLTQIFETAAAEGVITKNPATLLYTPRECRRSQVEAMKLEEVKRIFQILPLRERLIVKFAVLGGMRPGEIFGLKRCHIGNSEVSVSQRVYRGDIDTPKTTKSARKVAVPEGLRRDLDEWLKSSPAGVDNWLFPSETLKSPLSKDNVWRRYIAPKLATLGLGWVNFQLMRRTHASLMRELDVDPKIVADQQGHTLDVNLNVYTQTSMESRINAVTQLESALVH